MKPILATAILTLVTATAALADPYSVFRVCEDKHVLHTSDGADAGHVEYIVVDPGDQRIVSTVVTGGVIGERHVVVPFSEMRFGADREVTFTQITRERFVSAPVIETTRFSTSSYVEPAVIEPTFTHFGVSFNRTNITENNGGRGNVDRGNAERANAERDRARNAADAARPEGNLNAPGGDPRRMREGAAARRDGQPGTENPARNGVRSNEPRREGEPTPRATATDGTANAPEVPVQASKRSPARGTGGAPEAATPAGVPERARAKTDAAGEPKAAGAADSAERTGRAKADAAEHAGHGKAEAAGDAAQAHARGAATEAAGAAKTPVHEGEAARSGAAKSGRAVKGEAKPEAAEGAPKAQQ